jgi:muramoyltetrapeptide carboxypeptidase
MVGSDLNIKITLESLLYPLMNITPKNNVYNPPESVLTFIGKGYTCGTLVGGNLSLLCSTMGTPYEIDTKDKILFIEEIGESPYRIDRLLTQLELGKKLQECSGFILGQFTDCTLPNYEKSLTLEEVLAEKILSFNKPTVLNLMAGHCDPKLTLPIGAKFKIDCHNRLLEVLEAVVRE